MRAIAEPENWREDIKEEIRKERKHARALLKEGKYKEVIAFIDGIYGFYGELKEEYTKEEAKKAISSLL